MGQPSSATLYSEAQYNIHRILFVIASLIGQGAELHMREFDIVELFSSKHGSTRKDVATGIGDDAAQITPLHGYSLIVVTSICCGDHHFHGAESGRELARECLEKAMRKFTTRTGIPAWLTLALTMPAENEAWISAFSSEIHRQATAENIQIVGGDTTRGTFSLTLNLMGYTGK